VTARKKQQSTGSQQQCAKNAKNKSSSVSNTTACGKGGDS